MTNILNFIRWALTHVKPESVPAGAVLANGTAADVGAEPWHYLFGTVRVKTTPARIEERWQNHYKNTWTREAYDSATAAMRSGDYATDCQGLLDAYLTCELGEKTDVNADYNYKNWCGDKGGSGEAERPYKLGEAVFMANSRGRMTHVGWICGLDTDGEPLVIEARGLAYGVVITRLESRPWTHRGLMTKKFEYKEDENMDKPVRLERTSPMMQGEYITALQIALNALGYTDADGSALEEDGKCGARTMQAVRSFANAHADCCAAEPVETVMPIAVFESADGAYRLAVIRDKAVDGE